MHLDEIVNWIDAAFGEASPAPDHADAESVQRMLGEQGYERFLQDQVNRRIIRDYLTNAVVLGVITEGGLAAFASRMVTEDRRAILALYMLMSSVEEAMDIPAMDAPGEVLQLRPLAEPPQSPLKLVPS